MQLYNLYLGWLYLWECHIVEDDIHSLSFPFYNSDESQNKNKLIGLHPFDSQIMFRGGNHGNEAAMHAEPFHQQWFILVTHNKHKILQTSRNNIKTSISLFETATEH